MIRCDVNLVIHKSWGSSNIDLCGRCISSAINEFTLNFQREHKAEKFLALNHNPLEVEAVFLPCRDKRIDARVACCIPVGVGLRNSRVRDTRGCQLALYPLIHSVSPPEYRIITCSST